MAIMMTTWIALTKRYGTIFPTIRKRRETFMLLSRIRVPCPLSEMNVLERGMTMKNIENTSQAGTLCWTAEGALNDRFPL